MKKNSVTLALIAKLDSSELERIGLIIDTGDELGALYMGSGVMKTAAGRVVDVPLNAVRKVRVALPEASQVPVDQVPASTVGRKPLFKV